MLGTTMMKVVAIKEQAPRAPDLPGLRVDDVADGLSRDQRGLDWMLSWGSIVWVAIKS